MKQINKINSEKGITLVALVIAIIIMLIIVSISVDKGMDIVSKSKVQTIETNMLTIEAKAKAYAEEIEAKIWNESDKNTARDNEFKAESRGFTDAGNLESIMTDQVSDEIKSGGYVAYSVTGDALIKMGLDELKDQTYIVIINKNDYKLMDIIYTKGLNYNNNKYYSLSRLQSALEGE